jgi:hypothetical protein
MIAQNCVLIVRKTFMEKGYKCWVASLNPTYETLLLRLTAKASTNGLPGQRRIFTAPARRSLAKD